MTSIAKHQLSLKITQLTELFLNSLLRSIISGENSKFFIAFNDKCSLFEFNVQLFLLCNQQSIIDQSKTGVALCRLKMFSTENHIQVQHDFECIKPRQCC